MEQVLSIGKNLFLSMKGISVGLYSYVNYASSLKISKKVVLFSMLIAIVDLLKYFVGAIGRNAV